MFKRSKKKDAVVYEAPTSNLRYHFMAKVVVIGDKASGKTTLAKKYCQNVFRQDYLPTIGVNFETKELPVDDEGVGKKMLLQLWDLAGDEHFGWVREGYYGGTRGCIMVVDTTREETLKHVEGWFHEMYNSGVPSVVPTVLLCNKSDLESHRQVYPKQVKEMLDMIYDTNECKGYRKLPVQVFETSAKTGQNVEASFTALAGMILDRIRHKY